MILFALCAGILLFDVNRASICYLNGNLSGDGHSCSPKDVQYLPDKFEPGEAVFVTKDHFVPQIYNGLYGVWFALVTMTSGFSNDSFHHLLA